MENKISRFPELSLAVAVMFAILNAPPSTVLAQGTAFSYQGRLNASGSPASGLYDFRFRLAADPLGNTILGTMLTNAIPVTNGLFATTIDFGAGLFNGTNRWLEVDVRTNGNGIYNMLSPLQAITPAPFALFAVNGNVGPQGPAGPQGAAGATGQTGAAGPQGPPGTNAPGAITNQQTGVTLTGSFSGSFSGNGANLTALNANNISSGTLGLAQLPAGVITNGASGVSITGSFTGNGSGLTNLNAQNIAGYGTWSTNYAFGLVSSPAVGGGPVSVCAADVNGDGKLELICVNSNANTLTILTNAGGGIYGSNATYAVGSGPVSVAAFTNVNGRWNLVCANYNDGTLTVLTNAGGGIFGSNATYTVGNNPVSVCAADMNGDGKMDLICAIHAPIFSTGLAVWTNNGNGGFVLSWSAQYSSGIFPVFVMAADVNGDGKMDFVNVNTYVAGNGNTLMMWTNDGHGGFAISSTPAVGSYPVSVAAFTNFDGKVALVCANQGDGTLTVLTNAGGGIFGSNATYTLPNIVQGATLPCSVCAADVNGDGKVDLICGGSDSDAMGGLVILTNNGSGAFVFSAIVNRQGDNPACVIAADVNGDGLMDLISANPLNGNGIDVWTNSATASYAIAGGGGSLPSGVLTNNATGVTLSGVFTGDGSGLTNLNLSSLSGFILDGSDNTGLGIAALNNDFFPYASGNTAVGYQALEDNEIGSQNTAIGMNALLKNDVGGNSMGTASMNTAVGFGALQFNATGGNNTAIGANALATNNNGAYNTAVGWNALDANSSGGHNIALGCGAGSLLTGNYNIDIGHAGVASESSTIRIGTQGTQTKTYIAGIYGTTVSGSAIQVNSSGQLGVASSSRKFKQDIQSMAGTSDELLALRPVTFKYKPEVEPQGLPQFGLIAEEVEQVDPNLVVHDQEHGIYTVRYDAVNAMLLNEFLKEHKTVEAQSTEIQDLKARLDKLEQLLETRNGGGK